jgi:hypothetical protein
MDATDSQQIDLAQSNLTSSPNILVLGTKVDILIGKRLQDGLIPISVTTPSGRAYSRLFMFDPDTSIITCQSETEAYALLRECHGNSRIWFRVIRSVFAVPIYIIDFFVSIIRGFLGSFVGFGFYGIIVVILLGFISLIVGIYGFVFASPFILLSYALKWYEQSVYKRASQKLISEIHQIVSQVA